MYAIPAMLFQVSPTVIAMCSAGVALLLAGGFAAKNEIARARGLDKIAALGDVSFAIPLAVFGALHLFGPDSVLPIVPEYMPWPMFWVYLVGFGLMAASVSIALRIGVRWSGFLFGIMMFLFVAMIHFPGALEQPHNRIIRTIVFRELSFGGAGWLLAWNAADGWQGKFKSTLLIVGRVCVTIALFVFGIEHFLHPLGLPGVPLQKEMPAWIPGSEIIDYVTGAALLVGGGSVLLAKHSRTVLTILGGWIVLLVLVIYGPVLILALADPDTGIRIQGINYFADTLLFAGVILALARATARSEARGSLT